MNHDLDESDLSTVLAEGRLIGDETKRAFGLLSRPQINWRPGAGEWSIGQCYDHLILSNRPYVPMIEDILEGRRHSGAWERIPLLPRFFGRVLIKALRPDIGRKTRARPAFEPSTGPLEPDVIARFLAQQDRLLALMDATRRLDLDDIIVRSPVVRFVTYSLMDAYRLIVVHEQNHVLQARRVTESPGFPADAPAP